MRLQDISKDQLHLIARILHQPTSEHWVRYAERVYCLEQQLDRALLRPDFLRRLVQLPQSHYADLCGLHKILNAKIVHQIFVLVATEVGVRLNSLIVAGRDRLGHETWDCSILNLRSLHGAWLKQKVFWDTFGKTLDVAKSEFTNEDYMVKWHPEENKCEGCILARIGGDLNTVFDLHMVVKSRQRTRSVRRYHEPKLLPIIEGWLQMWKLHYGTNEWEQKLEWNRLRAVRLKQIRRLIAREKGRSRRRHRDGERRHRRPEISGPIIDHQPQGSYRDDIPSKSSRSSHTTGITDATSGYRPSSSADRETEPELEASDDEDAEVKRVVDDAENELVDSYNALISTPFLPGMNDEEHQRLASILSRHSISMIHQVDPASWPMVGDEAVKERLARSQTTKNKPPSNYSESIYSQNFESRKSPLPHLPSGYPSDLRRNNTVQERRASGKSWATASIVPSATASHITIPSIVSPQRRNKHDNKFDTIAEESSSARNSKRFDNEPVSPIWNDKYGDRTWKQPRHDRSRSVSPVSPLSPTVPYLPPKQGLRESHRSNGKGPERPASKRNSSYYGPGPSSRLSRPFDGPSTEPGTILDSVRQLRIDSPSPRPHRGRDSTASHVTHWSLLYGPEREKIRQLEEDFRTGNYKPEPKASKKDRRR